MHGCSHDGKSSVSTNRKVNTTALPKTVVRKEKQIEEMREGDKERERKKEKGEGEGRREEGDI